MPRIGLRFLGMRSSPTHPPTPEAGAPRDSDKRLARVWVKGLGVGVGGLGFGVWGLGFRIRG